MSIEGTRTRPLIRRPAAPPSSKLILATALFALPACRATTRSDIEAVYDEATGRLELLRSDTNGNGRADTTSYVNGTRIVRIEIDEDEDGRPDRWQYYDGEQRLDRVGISRLGDGREDTWLFPTPDGSVERVEIRTGSDRKGTRTEYYDMDLLVRAEEDGDADGKIEKWEHYEAGRLTSVAFDTTGRGVPDRRLVYGPDGSGRLESDTSGKGQFEPVHVPGSRDPAR